jgi:hypothetical protein
VTIIHAVFDRLGMLCYLGLFLLSGLLPQLVNSLSPVGVADCSRRSITSSETREFALTIFGGCTTTDNGGAIYVYNTAAALRVSNCQFSECRASGKGGAIYFYSGYSIILNGFTGIDCSGTGGEAFCYFLVSSSQTKVIEFNESIGFKGNSKFSSFYIVVISATETSREVIQLLNSSFNSVDDDCSAIEIGPHYYLSVQFCRFHSNSPHNTFLH